MVSAAFCLLRMFACDVTKLISRETGAIQQRSLRVRGNDAALSIEQRSDGRESLASGSIAVSAGSAAAAAAAAGAEYRARVQLARCRCRRADCVLRRAPFCSAAAAAANRCPAAVCCQRSAAIRTSSASAIRVQSLRTAATANAAAAANAASTAAANRAVSSGERRAIPAAIRLSARKRFDSRSSRLTTACAELLAEFPPVLHSRAGNAATASCFDAPLVSLSACHVKPDC